MGLTSISFSLDIKENKEMISSKTDRKLKGVASNCNFPESSFALSSTSFINDRRVCPDIWAECTRSFWIELRLVSNKISNMPVIIIKKKFHSVSIPIKQNVE